MLFLALVLAVGVERLVEIRVSKAHLAWSAERGGQEFGAGHYPAMVVLHTGFLVGAVVEVLIRGCPPGLGAPVYGKLDTDLAAAMMSINAVKAVEIGEGMAAARLRGTENADEIRMGPNGPEFLANNAGGILGGISTGQDIVLRFAVKPTSSILTPRRTINRAGEEIDLVTKGRHDPCVGIRAVPVAEAMAACVILDHLLLDRAQTGGRRGEIG